MPEIKNTFLKSKMNKDLDARLVPNGEYRDAQNVSISRSEGSDVGALENVLGNKALTTLKTNIGILETAKVNGNFDSKDGTINVGGLDIIGFYMDVTNDRIFLFLTDYIDSSNDQLSNFAPADITTSSGNPAVSTFNAKGACCYIVQYNTNPNNIINDYRVLVAGNFLNFSKTHPILNVNLIEDLLFFTDNRNQPRKINVSSAFNDSYELSGTSNPYYYSEDQISVAKFAPFSPASFLDTSSNSGLLDVSNKYLGAHIVTTLAADTGSTGTFFRIRGEYNLTGSNADIIGGGADAGDLLVFPFQQTSDVGNSFPGTINTNQTNFSDGTYQGTVGVDTGFTTSGAGSGMEITIKITGNTLSALSNARINTPGVGFESGDTITISSSVLGSSTGSLILEYKGDAVDTEMTREINTVANGTGSSSDPNDTCLIGVSGGNLGFKVAENTLVKIKRRNPYYDDLYTGDERLLKDKFAKFSYRFKYDDGEYSIMAPFTQAAFIPNQFGYFTEGDEDKALKSGVVDFFENSVSKVKLNILLPFRKVNIENKLKVSEIQILVKNSDELAVRVVEDVPISKLTSAGGTSFNYEYTYLSSKPIKALPEADLIRVADKAPIRAMTQEIVGNRVVYGNFIEKHATPDYLEYDVRQRQKTYPTGSSDANIAAQNFTKTYPTHSIKQNRSYQIGIVLFDRYGRPSNVIFSDPETITAQFSNSTIYSSYSNFGSDSLSFWGNYLSFQLTNPIPNSGKVGYPGLYSITNPLGYYSYRIVVKQQEQEYYNVYAPGALAGEINWSTAAKSNRASGYTIPELLPEYLNLSKFSNISLQGDNINKIPRDLKEANANDVDFSSSTLLFPRVNPTKISTTSNQLNFKYHNIQAQETTKKPQKVVSIVPFKDLGVWTRKKGVLFNGNAMPTTTSSSSSIDFKPNPWYPFFIDNLQDDRYMFHDIFFNATKNPFIATIETEFKVGLEPVYLNGRNSDKRKGLESAWQSLAVFETDPVESNLEIYYESSTSGLISDLNTQTGIANGPFSLRDTNNNDTATGDLEFFANENMTLGTACTLYFEAFDNQGTACADNANTMTISSIKDGNNNLRPGLFDIEVKPGGGVNNREFRLKTNSLFVYLHNSFIEESFTIQLTVTANNETQLITLNNCRLQNTAPQVSEIILNGDGRASLPNGHTISNLPSFSHRLPPDPNAPNTGVNAFLYTNLLYSGFFRASGNGSQASFDGIEILRFTLKNGSVDTNRDEEEILAYVRDSLGNPNSSDYFLISNNAQSEAITSNPTGYLGPNKFCIIPNTVKILEYFNNNPSENYLIIGGASQYGNGLKVVVKDANGSQGTTVNFPTYSNGFGFQGRGIIFARPAPQ